MNLKASASDSPTPEVSRRTLVKGAAWTVPVIAATVAVPYASASACDGTGVINWGASFVRSGNNGGSGSVLTADGRTVTYNVSIGYGARIAGGSGGRPRGVGSAIEFGHFVNGPAGNTDIWAADTQTISITFSEPIADLSFRIRDIDGQSSTYLVREYVQVTAATAVNATPNSGVVLDRGYYRARNTGDVDPNNLANSVSYTTAGPTSSLTIRFATPLNIPTAFRPEPGIFLDAINFRLPC